MDVRMMSLLAVVLMTLGLSEAARAASASLRKTGAAARADSNEPVPPDPNRPAATDPNHPRGADPNDNGSATTAPAGPNEPAPHDSNEPAGTDPNDPNESAPEQDYLDMSLEELMEVEVASAALTPGGIPADTVAIAAARERAANSPRGDADWRLGVSDEGAKGRHHANRTGQRRSSTRQPTQRR